MQVWEFCRLAHTSLREGFTDNDGDNDNDNDDDSISHLIKFSSSSSEAHVLH